MNFNQSIFLILFAILSCFVFFISVFKCKRNQSYTELPLLFLLGIFVWGDALVFGPFWLLVSLFVLSMQQWTLFLLIFSVFWLVRSLGESIYWFNQQFSTIERNQPKKLVGYNFVKNDSVWYLYQIFWQCITVISSIASLYFSKIWLAQI